MSFQEEKRESIKRYLLDKIRQDDESFISKTMENFEISITTVKRYLKEFLESEIVYEAKECRTGYRLIAEMSEYAYQCKDYLDESNIFYTDIRNHLEDVTDEAKSIWSYAFTEMMNNAIEHSQCKNIHCTTKEIFDMYAPVEEGFVRTRIPLAEVCPFAEPVARSQARRILYRLEQFKKIEFDFSGVEFMGQGFADEVFRIFQNKYPEIQLIPIHANPTVLGMIRHVQR